MTSTTTDVIDGVSSSTAIKAPVRCKTTANITLSGFQVTDGITVADADTNKRTLVASQDDATENGIYDQASGAWQRSADFDGNRDVRKGTIITVNEGTLGEDTTWRVTTADPIVIGTSNIAFEAALLNDADVISFTQEGSGAVARSVQDKLEEIVSVKDFGATGDGVTDDTDAIVDFFAAGVRGYIPAGTYRCVGTELSMTHGSHIFGAGAGKTIIQFESMGGFAGTNGISITQTGKHIASSLTDMTISIKGAHGKYGITTPRGSSVFNTNTPRYYFSRLVFKGDVEDGTLTSLYDYGWARYIDLGDSRDAVLEDILVLGTYNYTTDPASANIDSTAFYISGVQSEGGVLTPIVRHCYAHYVGKAVQYGYRVSNPFVTDSQFHRVYDGILSPNATTSGTDYSALEVQLHNLNINAQRRGVSFEKASFLDMSSIRVTRASGGFDHANTWYGYYFDEIDELKISGARAYNEGTAYTTTHVGLFLTASDYPKIDNLSVRGAAANGITTALLLEDNRFMKISGPSFTNATTAFRFETASSGSPEVSIIGPQFGANVTTPYSYESGVSKTNVLVVDDYAKYESVDTSATSVTTAGTTTLVRGTDNQVKKFSFGAGAGAYAHDIKISNTNAVSGDIFVIHIALTSANPTVRVLDNADAAQVTLTTASPTERYRVEMVFGTAWRCIGATLSVA